MTRNFKICTPHINIILEIISRIMKWAEHVALWGTIEVHTDYWWESLRERDNLEDLGERCEDSNKTNLQGMGWDHGLD